MDADFRIRNMQDAFDRAEAYDAMAASGGDALFDADEYARKSARSRAHAAWIAAKIAAHPFQVA